MNTLIKSTFHNVVTINKTRVDCKLPSKPKSNYPFLSNSLRSKLDPINIPLTLIRLNNNLLFQKNLSKFPCNLKVTCKIGCQNLYTQFVWFFFACLWGVRKVKWWKWWFITRERKINGRLFLRKAFCTLGFICDASVKLPHARNRKVGHLGHDQWRRLLVWDFETLDVFCQGRFFVHKITIGPHKEG